MCLKLFSQFFFNLFSPCRLLNNRCFSRARLQLSSLPKSHIDDVKVRGGARMPRRSLCNEFILLILKTFRPFFVCVFFYFPGASLKDIPTTTAASVDRRQTSGSRNWWKLESGECSLVSGLDRLGATQVTDASSFTSPSRMLLTCVWVRERARVAVAVRCQQNYPSPVP